MKPRTATDTLRSSAFRRTSILALLTAAWCGAQAGWKSETTRDGKVLVLSRISHAPGPDGQTRPIVEYRATTIVRADFERCLSVLKDVSSHKRIHDDKSSEVVSQLPDGDMIVHYTLKMIWPLPSTDCVARMHVERDSVARTATVSLTGAPGELPPRADRRLSEYQQTYILKDIGDGTVELGSRGRSAPPFAVPKWILNSAFPAAAADPLQRIVELSRAGKGRIGCVGPEVPVPTRILGIPRAPRPNRSASFKVQLSRRSFGSAFGTRMDLNCRPLL